MKVFVSSVIGGFETFREAASDAVRSLGYEVIRAEDFGASPTSPQVVCLASVREADLVVLLLGARYGAKQASGLSATHEEYNEARTRRRVIAFVQGDVEFEAEQADFVQEVREWETGTLTAGFATESELRDAVTREIHRHIVSASTQPIDHNELLVCARESIGDASNRWTDPQLVLSMAAGPRQEVLRPSELEDTSFARDLQRQALFGPAPLFDVEAGIQTDLRDDWLVLSQESSSIQINSAGDIVIRRPALRVDTDYRSLPALIEEEIEERLARALHFDSATLERIDPVRRLSYIGIIAVLVNGSYHAWRTRAEHASSPNSMNIGGTRRSQVVVQLTPSVRHRAEIGQHADDLAHDLMVLLRREFRR